MYRESFIKRRIRLEEASEQRDGKETGEGGSGWRAASVPSFIWSLHRSVRSTSLSPSPRPSVHLTSLVSVWTLRKEEWKQIWVIIDNNKRFLSTNGFPCRLLWGWESVGRRWSTKNIYFFNRERERDFKHKHKAWGSPGRPFPPQLPPAALLVVSMETRIPPANLRCKKGNRVSGSWYYIHCTSGWWRIWMVLVSGTGYAIAVCCQAGRNGSGWIISRPVATALSFPRGNAREYAPNGGWDNSSWASQYDNVIQISLPAVIVLECVGDRNHSPADESNAMKSITVIYHYFF